MRSHNGWGMDRQMPIDIVDEPWI
ncbi:hypothetical protein AGR2A_Cc140109 [Agrobacterium genomosp. 2 str. CFBP 5494]|uniref:Uncharacterized protein n=1 Tax=Agrobacterium genomosp. 2 str. CFBP 5494 TaxID=1183436 RepID=A0A9W5AZ46_9HYPH|nr:hypothetical protein AGR2A_Cc140109 [Agrobacterium genomosp. 2 str. CFBP 5494]